MTKPTANPLPALVQGFFAQHLTNERQLSLCTVASYRDTFRLLLAYVQDQTAAGTRLTNGWRTGKHRTSWPFWTTWKTSAIVARAAATPDWPPSTASCAMSPSGNPGVWPWPAKFWPSPTNDNPVHCLGYLTPAEVQAVLEAPAPDTFSGRRDRLLFQLLYNTGARVSEVVALNRQDLLPDSCQTVTLHGKGRKQRTVPLWPKTSRQLRRWLDQLPTEPSTPVFANRLGSRLSRFGIEKRLAEAAQKATLVCPSLRGRRVSPHVLRHYADLRTMPTGDQASLLDARSDRAFVDLGRATDAA